MKEYIAKCVSELDWSKVEAQPITECAWSPNKAPAASVKAVFLDGKALVFRVESYAPPTRAENTEPDSPVYQDSCLECFFSFDGKNYVNLEGNSKGALLCATGSGRHGRQALRTMGIVLPELTAQVWEKGWCAQFTVPVETVCALWGRSVAKGDRFFANFYSCGDKTPSPHYASWNPVNTESPDFHRPEYFGIMRIE